MYNPRYMDSQKIKYHDGHLRYSECQSDKTGNTFDPRRWKVNEDGLVVPPRQVRMLSIIIAAGGQLSQSYER